MRMMGRDSGAQLGSAAGTAIQRAWTSAQRDHVRRDESCDIPLPSAGATRPSLSSRSHLPLFLLVDSVLNPVTRWMHRTWTCTSVSGWPPRSHRSSTDSCRMNRRIGRCGFGAVVLRCCWGSDHACAAMARRARGALSTRRARPRCWR